MDTQLYTRLFTETGLNRLFLGKWGHRDPFLPGTSIALKPGMKTFLSLSGMAACLLFGGCYTQLYTQGHLARSENDPYARYGYSGDEEQAGDSALSNGDSAMGGDSTQEARSGRPEGDTLTGQPGTVIVNNYYRESPYYRGYAISDWGYPSVHFGFYNSGYRDYYGPYWWSDPGYHHRRHYRNDYDRPSAGGGTGGGVSGSYQSDKRLFSHPAPGPRKGRRAAEPESSSPPAAKAAQSDPVYVAPSTPPSTSTQSASPSSSPSDSESSGHNAKPALKKGRRR